MSSKKSISNFKKMWRQQATLTKPLAIMPEGESETVLTKNRVTELDLRLSYTGDVGGQHKQGQVGELYRLQLTGYSRWIEEKLIELLNQNYERSNRY